MVQKILTSPYFVVALIVIILILLFLFIRSKSCRVEGMSNLKSSHHLLERPWTEDDDESGFKLVGNKFDKYADQIANKIIGRSSNDHIKTKQDLLNELISKDAEAIIVTKKKNDKQLSKNIPQPFDGYSRYNECPPCVCPGDKYIPESESDNETVYVYKRPVKKTNK
ncbi:hypothetical protein QKC54_gp0576 [Megavirus baoshan]|uniref:Uncharacterized protein n=1 Tax=Megavirus baoshan TaxID=2496520 RepID=A0A3Q8U7Q4_9VIRU|nr:hypothetical protein QKC54_gp0576 [Megavirus baoshan]AZL89257.1 hypothetical protein Mb0496 [Megavirus baoshan]